MTTAMPLDLIYSISLIVVLGAALATATFAATYVAILGKRVVHLERKHDEMFRSMHSLFGIVERMRAERSERDGG